MKQDFSSVQGKVAIVTGASRGIGRAIAQVYGVNGIRVVCAARSADQGQAVADAICKEGGEAIFVRTDCSQPEDIRALVDAAVKSTAGWTVLSATPASAWAEARCTNMRWKIMTASLRSTAKVYLPV